MPLERAHNVFVIAFVVPHALCNDCIAISRSDQAQYGYQIQTLSEVVVFQLVSLFRTVSKAVIINTTGKVGQVSSQVNASSGSGACCDVLLTRQKGLFRGEAPPDQQRNNCLEPKRAVASWFRERKSACDIITAYFQTGNG